MEELNRIKHVRGNWQWDGVPIDCDGATEKMVLEIADIARKALEERDRLTDRIAALEAEVEQGKKRYQDFLDGTVKAEKRWRDRRAVWEAENAELRKRLEERETP